MLYFILGFKSTHWLYAIFDKIGVRPIFQAPLCITYSDDNLHGLEKSDGFVWNMIQSFQEDQIAHLPYL